VKDKVKIILIFTAVAMFLSGCKNESNLKDSNKQNKKGIRITESWMRPAAINRNSACFLKITNTSKQPDTLIGVSSELAKLVQFHLTFKNSDGTMGMKQVFSIPIKANTEFSFEPGNYHVMLIGMNKTMKLQEQGQLTFQFRNAGSKTITAIVKDFEQ